MLILRDYNIPIKPHQLGHLYKRHGITYRNTKRLKKDVIRNHTSLEQLRGLRARQIASIMYRAEPIVFVDETTFNLDMPKKSTWQK